MNIEELNEIIKNKPSVMLYFSGAFCSVCKVLHPKVTSAVKSEYPLIEHIVLEVEENPLIAAQYNVFAMPTIIVYFEGKEFIRKARNISVSGFIDEIKRPYGLFFNV